MIEAVNMDQVHIKVKDIAESIQFYNAVFGFEVKKELKENEQITVVGNGLVKLHLHENPDVEPDPESQNIVRFGFYVENYDELSDICNQKNISVIGEKSSEGCRSLYIQDPNGYEIVLSELQGNGL